MPTAFVFIISTIRPLVTTGSMDSLNISNLRLNDLELFGFEIYSIRFNGCEPINFSLVKLPEPFLQIF